MLEVNPITVSGCQNGYPKKKRNFFYPSGTALPYTSVHIFKNTLLCKSKDIIQNQSKIHFSLLKTLSLLRCEDLHRFGC
jgi:hypothetical protein